MNLAFKFLLSPRTTQEVDQHRLHPFIHWWSHQQSTSSTFRRVSFPDVVPRLSDTFRLDEGDFFNMSSGWSYVVTLFFIDTSLNVIKTIQHIYSLLATLSGFEGEGLMGLTECGRPINARDSGPDGMVVSTAGTKSDLREP